MRIYIQKKNVYNNNHDNDNVGCCCCDDDDVERLKLNISNAYNPTQVRGVYICMKQITL